MKETKNLAIVFFATIFLYIKIIYFFLMSVARIAIIISNKTCASINADGGETTTTYSIITHTS